MHHLLIRTFVTNFTSLATTVYKLPIMTAIGITCTPSLELRGIILEFIRNSPSSIVFYLEMKVEVEVGVHDIKSRFTPGYSPCARLNGQSDESACHLIGHLGGHK